MATCSRCHIAPVEIDGKCSPCFLINLRQAFWYASSLCVLTLAVVGGAIYQAITQPVGW